MIPKIYKEYSDILDPEIRSSLSAFVHTSTPTKEQIARFNRLQFKGILDGGRSGISALPDDAFIPVWYGKLTVAKGATVDAPDLTRIYGEFSDINGDAQLNAPVLTRANSVLLASGSSLNAPLLDTVSTSIFLLDGAKMSAPALKSIGGVLDLQTNSSFEAPALRTIGGAINVASHASFKARHLQNARSLVLHPGVVVEAPELDSVAEWVVLFENSSLSSESLKEVGGISLHKNCVYTAPSLRNVTCSVNVKDGAVLNTPNLEKIRNDLNLYSAAINAPKLKEIGGWFVNFRDANLTLPSLSRVGDLFFDGGMLNAPALTDVGRVNVFGSSRIDAPALARIGEEVFVHPSAQFSASPMLLIGGSPELTPTEQSPTVRPALPDPEALQHAPPIPSH